MRCSTRVDDVDRPTNVTYRYGDSVVTALWTGPAAAGLHAAGGRPVTAAVTLGRLAVPRPSVHGRCSHTSPLRFLEDSSARCVVPLTSPGLCSDDSGPLSARAYVESARWGTVDSVAVLARPGDPAAAADDVHFLCVEDVDFRHHSAAAASRSAAHRSYALFADDDCPPNCRRPSDAASHTMPLWRSVVSHEHSSLPVTSL